MKVQTYTKEIPAHTETIKVWISVDGKTFDNEAACKKYEDQLILNSQPVMKSRTTVTDFDNASRYDVYYVSSEEDWNSLYNFLKKESSRVSGDTYAIFGVGWYLIDRIFNFNIGDEEIHIFYFKNWVREEDVFYNNWRQPIRERFGI